MRISDWSSDVCSSDLTRVFLCHDYKAPNRTEFVWETTMLAQRTANVHLHEDVDEGQLVEMRTQRDATLEMPRLILPAIQVNMPGGHLPPPEDAIGRASGRERVFQSV